MGKTVECVCFDRFPELKRKRVAAYARVSADSDGMRHSLAAQVSYYSEMIQQNPEWEYCGVYADEALTGTKEDRTNFQRLLADCRAGRIDMVITKSISRFARNTVTLLQTVRELKELGVGVLFEEQNIHTLKAEGELLLTLLASFAQEESLSVSENIKWRIRKGFENGEIFGLHRMFGYTIFKGEFTVNEKQAEIVREIFARAVRGDSLESIARWLNENGVKGAQGGTFIEPRVREVLENEKYTGNALLQKTYINNHLEKKKLRNRGELPMYYVEGSHEAIIDMETFEQVQKRLQAISDSTAGRRPQKRTVFTSKIKCAKCGATFVRSSNHKVVWQCTTYRHEGRGACDAKQIPEDILIRESCEVLGLAEFDEQAFLSRVVSIRADDDSNGRVLSFFLNDGEKVIRRWNYPSRSKFWTPEMREKARKAWMEREGRKDG